MSYNESFTYVISSNDRTNSIGTNTNTYDIDFGGFSSNHETYLFEVLNILLSGQTLDGNNMLILVANDLADNGYFCSASLNTSSNALISRPTIVGFIPLVSTVDMFNSGSGGISFVVKNCRIKRKIRFKLIKSNFVDAVDTVDINVGGESKWFLTMRVTAV